MLLKRYCDSKDTSVSIFTGEIEMTIQQIDISFYDVQSQTGALNIGGIAGPEKTLKHMFFVVFGNSDALVPNGEGDVFSPELVRDVNIFIFLGIFAGIRKQIEHNVPKNPGVGC